jgi:hypothetical protein
VETHHTARPADQRLQSLAARLRQGWAERVRPALLGRKRAERQPVGLKSRRGLHGCGRWLAKRCRELGASRRRGLVIDDE